MINNIGDFKYLEQEYNIPFHELFTIDLNLSGIAIDLNFSRIRFSLYLQNGKLLSFSVENDKSSFYKIKSNKLFLKIFFCLMWLIYTKIPVRYFIRERKEKYCVLIRTIEARVVDVVFVIKRNLMTNRIYLTEC